MADVEYRRLTRPQNRSRFALVTTSKSSLWLAKDHLLVIDTSGYTESYKRFRFRDVQALVLCRTDSWLYRAVILAGLASLSGLLAIVIGGPIAAWIFGIIAALFGFFLLVDLIAGPTSKCYLRTAVQTEPLASLSRLRRAERVLSTLRPLILQAQSEGSRAPAPGGQSSVLTPVLESAAAAPSLPQAEASTSSTHESA